MSSDQKRPQIPTDMKAFNAKLIEEFRANKGRLSGQMAGSRLLLLTTTGAQTGAEHTVVVGYRPYNEDLAIIASNNGAPGPPAWFHNLQKDPEATVELGSEKFKVRVRVAGPDERTEAARVIDYLEQQQARTGREIPIVILERA
jgi:deazaflavin-dependent oxidoreductase (nitroreductase family)